jgi:hypothetical protein
MSRTLFPQILTCVLLSSCGQLIVAQECSTEIVNGNCTVTIDRSYPVALPTIQMRPGKTLKVNVLNPLPFEILSLDLQSGQLVAGTDQTAGFLSAALPNLKGLLFQQQFRPSFVGPPPSPNTQDQINSLMAELGSDFAYAETFTNSATIVYNRLNEALGPIPPQDLPDGNRRQSSNVKPPDFPRPWVKDDFKNWRSMMLCDMVGQECLNPLPGDLQANPCAGNPPVLLCGSYLATNLAPCAPDKPDNKLIACKVLLFEGNLSSNDKKAFADQLVKLDSNVDLLAAAAGTIATINKDIAIYVANIKNSGAITPSEPIGTIIDPHVIQTVTQPSSGPSKPQIKTWIPGFLARQVVWSLNVVNEISVPSTSVITAAQKKSIVSITVVFADPKFEVSTGAIISTLPNRSFANQTIVTQNQSGSSPTLGNVIIAQSISNPTVVLFAGGNYRIGHDFLWPDKRRGAVYFTGTVGLNVNNSNAELGVGPSLSWRSLMFSVLYDWGHDVRLTQGEFVGMIWCNQSAPSPDGKIPKCSGNPPSPSTEKYWKGAVAFGISVRIPTVFNGGASH